MAFGNHLLKTEVYWYQPGLIEAPVFDENTVETLCTAVIKAEDAVICTDASGQQSTRPITILTEAEREQMFSTVCTFETSSIMHSNNADISRHTLHSMAP
jgi:hypothetical protein